MTGSKTHRGVVGVFSEHEEILAELVGTRNPHSDTRSLGCAHKLDGIVLYYLGKEKHYLTRSGLLNLFKRTFYSFLNDLPDSKVKVIAYRYSFPFSPACLVIVEIST